MIIKCLKLTNIYFLKTYLLTNIAPGKYTQNEQHQCSMPRFACFDYVVCLLVSIKLFFASRTKLAKRQI